MEIGTLERNSEGRRGEGNIWQWLLALNRSKKAWPTDVVLLTYLTDKLKHKSHILIYCEILGFMSRLDHVLLIMNNTNIQYYLSVSSSLSVVSIFINNLYWIIFKATHLEKFAIPNISVILTWYLPTFRRGQFTKNTQKYVRETRAYHLEFRHLLGCC